MNREAGYLRTAFSEWDHCHKNAANVSSEISGGYQKCPSIEGILIYFSNLAELRSTPISGKDCITAGALSGEVAAIITNGHEHESERVSEHKPTTSVAIMLTIITV